MLSNILANFYARDINALAAEINLFSTEEALWQIQGGIKNPAGNLALHITGGLNYLIGATLANTGYVRNRDAEFATKGIAKAQLVSGLHALVPMVTQTLNALTPQQMEAPYPFMFDGADNPVSYVLVQLLAHLNYHTGQVNYLRRMM